jgi:hypothetical protein
MLSRLTVLHPVFDGYAAAENRGTLALAHALDPAYTDPLFRLFCARFLKDVFPVAARDQIKPRLQLVLQPDSARHTAIPDAAFFNDDQAKVLLIESKVKPGTLSLAQLERHLKNAQRQYRSHRPVLLLVTPDRDSHASRVAALVERRCGRPVRYVSWEQIHGWIRDVLYRNARQFPPRSAGRFLLEQLMGFLQMKDWIGFQGFSDHWPDEYRIDEARVSLKQLRDYVHANARKVIPGYPHELLPTQKRITQPWIPLGAGKVHLTLYAWPAWTGVDLFVAAPAVRARFNSPRDKEQFLSVFKRLPDHRHLWLTASTWRLINAKQGRMTGPMHDAIALSLNASEVLGGSRFQDQLIQTVLDASLHTKALVVNYRFYYDDDELKDIVRRPEIGKRLLQAAGRLLRIYRWFRSAG